MHSHTAIAITSPVSPPEWALLERELLRAQQLQQPEIAAHVVLERRRGEQARAWLWSEINASLVRRFRDDARVRDTIANVLAHLQESLAGIRIVTAHNRRERAVIEHQNEAGEYLAANDRTAFLNGVYGPGAEAMGPLSQLVLLVVGGRAL